MHTQQGDHRGHQEDPHAQQGPQRGEDFGDFWFGFRGGGWLEGGESGLRFFWTRRLEQICFGWKKRRSGVAERGGEGVARGISVRVPVHSVDLDFEVIAERSIARTPFIAGLVRGIFRRPTFSKLLSILLTFPQMNQKEVSDESICLGDHILDLL